jgi:hypothetical protein
MFSYVYTLFTKTSFYQSTGRWAVRVTIQCAQAALGMVCEGMREAAVDRCGCRGATLQVLEFQRLGGSDSLLDGLLLMIVVVVVVVVVVVLLLLLDAGAGAAALSETI